MVSIKKFLIVLIITLAISLYGQNNNNLNFDIVNKGTLNLGDGVLNGNSSFGVSYNFNSGITAGFSLINVDDNNISTVEIGVEVAKGAHLTALSGNINDKFAFGLGLGYDFFTKKNRLFSSVGIYIDYIATNSDKDLDPYSLQNGGLFLIGLKTSLGI